MREATYSFVKNLFNDDQIKEINSIIKKNLNVDAKDAPAISAEKTSDVKFLKLGGVKLSAPCLLIEKVIFTRSFTPSLFLLTLVVNVA